MGQKLKLDFVSKIVFYRFSSGKKIVSPHQDMFAKNFAKKILDIQKYFYDFKQNEILQLPGMSSAKAKCFHC